MLNLSQQFFNSDREFYAAIGLNLYSWIIAVILWILLEFQSNSIASGAKFCYNNVRQSLTGAC